MMRGNSHSLQRFVEAQNTTFDHALAEIRRGAKRSHWMWFIFPQLAGLGTSEMAHFYGIRSAKEAQLYLAHALLGPRYLACVSALQDLADPDPVAVFGSVDAMKLRSSLTLFETLGGQTLITDVVHRWFDGKRDSKTLELLASM